MRVIVFTCLLISCLQLTGQEAVRFSGQASARTNINNGSGYPVWVGGGYLPQVNISFNPGKRNEIDFEASSNINGLSGITPFDSISGEGRIRAYRLWLRYSTNQFELRAGLQKINFGSATMIRPLMWFDQVDPRDPVQFTNGVWGLLGRYYFLNNVNIWFWMLYGNENPKTWEIGFTNNRQPEWGGRFQIPASNGEMALTFHYRLADTRKLINDESIFSKNPENRLGIDGKWDVGAGLWFETVWINKKYKTGEYTNQHLLTLGADYTFRVGQGITGIVEHLLYNNTFNPFSFNKTISLTTASVSYPLGLHGNLSSMIYYDWYNNSFYKMATFSHQLKSFSYYFMIYSNPEKNNPLTINESNSHLFNGNGLQLMVVFNY